MPNQRLVLRARLDTYSGYGQHASHLISDFTRFGYDLQVFPLGVDDYHAPIPKELLRHIVAKDQPDDWQLILFPPTLVPSKNKLTAFFSMWETTKLSTLAMESLSKADALIVPSSWGASCFNAQGLSQPLFICPLGVDTSVFGYSLIPPSTCVFGSAGNSVISGRSRKGLNDVIDAFQYAFPSEGDVMLKIKTLPGPDAVNETDDPRIQITATYLSNSDLAEWYQSLTCFVSASRGEGWGFMQLQAMACGRPVIAAQFGGLCEFFDRSVGYPVKYGLAPATGRYSGMGIWAEPDLYDMADQMRRVYENRDEAQRFGLESRLRAGQFTWERSHRRLEEILKELGFFS